MSRSGYSDGCEGWDLVRWRGAVASAIRGQRGQSFLKELASAMDAMSEKKLIEGELVNGNDVCAIGVVCKARGVDTSDIDPEDSEKVAGAVGISEALAKEIEYENDEGTWRNETDEERWIRVRAWVSKQVLTK